MISKDAALREIAAALAAAGIEAPRREARLLLAAALGTDAAGLLMATQADPAAYGPLLRRRAAREPLAYLTGAREFWGLAFKTSPATLIPRPDSETLVAAAVRQFRHAPPARVLDLGTGTGCLLLAVLSEFTGAFGLGVDISPPAAALAKANAAALGMRDRTAFIAGDWMDALRPGGRFGLILANPPYIPEDEVARLMPEVARYEPHGALGGGRDGLAAYRALVPALPAQLAPGGAAILEMGAEQAPDVMAIAAAAGFTGNFARDLGGHLRAAILRIGPGTPGALADAETIAKEAGRGGWPESPSGG